MSMNWKGALVAGAVLGAGVLAACSDAATAPSSRAAFVPKASFAVGDPTTVAPPLATELRICKAGNVGGNFTLTWAPGGGGTGNPTVIDQNAGTPGNQLTLAPGAGGAANCIMAAIDLGDANQEKGDFFTVTEALAPGVTTVRTCYINDGNAVADACPPNFFINTAHGWTVVFTNTAPPPPPPGNEGCTPGYWKQDQHFGSWAPVALNTTFTSVFGAGIYGGTLLQALGLNGGGIDALIRHGAAAYLNAQNATVDYQYTTAQVIDIVQGDGAYAGLSIEARKNLLDAANNGVGGCPLNRDEA